ncbi:hypothetical protein M1D93_13510 [Arthrobacter sp. Z1-9]
MEETDAQGDTDSIIARISDLARKDQTQRQDFDEKRVLALNKALAFLRELNPRTLQALDREFARSDGIATSAVFGMGFNGGPGVAQFIRSYCSPPSGLPLAPHSAAAVDARLIDVLLFRDILLAHGETMFFQCLTRVKGILGFGPDDSLAREGAGKYGARGVVLLLNTAHSLAKLQLQKTSAHVTASMGYSGIDAWADAKDDCHFMTAEFAKWILQRGPSPRDIAGLITKGRLDRFGISPSDVEPELLLAELSKVDTDAGASALASWIGLPQSSVRADRRSSLADLSDRGERSFDVQGVAGVKTAGDAFEAHIWRRQSKLRARQLKSLCWLMGSFGVPAFALWLSWPMVQQLLAKSSLDASTGAFTFLLVELLGGTLLAMGAVSLIDMRTSGFFALARAMSRMTVLQGKRTPEFLAALRKLRPGLFEAGRSGGVPRYFSMCFTKEGALLVSGGRVPDIAAAFPWDSIRAIDPEGAPKAGMKNSDTSQGVVLRVDHQGDEVRLAFPLERAKVAWTTRRYLEKKPIEGAVGIIQGLRSLSLAGVGLSFSDWSWQPAQHAAEQLGIRRGQVYRGLAAAALICLAGPLVLVLFLR